MQRKELSKVKNLTYSELEMQTYLSETKLPTRLKQLAFRWKTRMIKVGWNYGRKEKCPICFDAEDTQAHILQCDELNDYNMTNNEEYENYDLNGEIFA